MKLKIQKLNFHVIRNRNKRYFNEKLVNNLNKKTVSASLT